jgi:hypothetical protein
MDFIESIKVLVVCVFITVIVVGGVTLGANYGCKRQGLIMGRPVIAEFSTGCMVQTRNGDWMPMSSYLAIEFKKE